MYIVIGWKRSRGFEFPIVRGSNGNKLDSLDSSLNSIFIIIINSLSLDEFKSIFNVKNHFCFIACIYEFTKCNDFLWVCRFLTKNLAYLEVGTHLLWNSTIEMTFAENIHIKLIRSWHEIFTNKHYVVSNFNTKIG